VEFNRVKDKLPIKQVTTITRLLGKEEWIEKVVLVRGKDFDFSGNPTKLKYLFKLNEVEKIQKKDFDTTIKELSEKYGPVVTFEAVKGKFPYASAAETITKALESGEDWLKKVVLIRGKDFDFSGNPPNLKYLFKQNEVEKLGSLINFTEATRLFDVSESTLWRWRKDGQINDGLFGDKYIQLEWFEQNHKKIKKTFKDGHPIARKNYDRFQFIRERGGIENI
jgi:hypothetical protein